ncbi:MAG: hypothetical protein A49_23970 [Methyloceanibacter sp.]|nr:MAG: hypothetical protein A49_23970 [Methyloceanibacter sp.]
MDVPLVLILAAHEDLNGKVALDETAVAEMLQPIDRIVPRLLDKHSHGQAVHQPPRSLSANVVAAPESPPQPTDDRHGRLSEAGWDTHQGRWALRELRLEGERRSADGP